MNKKHESRFVDVYDNYCNGEPPGKEKQNLSKLPKKYYIVEISKEKCVICKKNLLIFFNKNEILTTKKPDPSVHLRERTNKLIIKCDKCNIIYDFDYKQE